MTPAPRPRTGGLPRGRRLRLAGLLIEAADRDGVVDVAPAEIGRLEPGAGLLLELARRGVGRQLALLDPSGDSVPIATLRLRAEQDEELLAPPDEDEDLPRSHTGKTT